ncbi:CD99 antigen isoform X2 [Lithobates pipiens]
MMARLPVLFCMLFLIAGIRGQELDLGDALGEDDPTVAPTPEKKIDPTVKPADVPKPATLAPKADPKPATSAPKPAPKPHDDADFDLGDAVGGDEPTTPKNQPGRGGGGGGGGGSLGDDDLIDAAGGLPPHDPSEHDGKPSGGQEEGQGQEKQSVIAGVLSALGVAAVGAVSSFIAYQKKKLCFKGQAEDPENVNMDNQKDQNDPQVQTNLLSK